MGPGPDDDNWDSTPGASCRVTPGDVFSMAGRAGIRAGGRCHLRGERRAFRLDHVELADDAEVLAVFESSGTLG